MEKLITVMQESKMVGQALLLAGAIVSAFLTEIMTNKLGKHGENSSSEQKNRGGIIFLLLHSIICLVIFEFELSLVLFLTMSIFHTIPQEESMLILVQRTADYYGWSFVLPFAASALAGFFLRMVKEGHSKVLLCIFLVLTIIFGSIQFFLETFRLVKRPNLPFPAEAVSAIVNSRLRAYPLALSREELKQIGDGSELLVEETDGPPSSDITDEPSIDAPTEVYEEPNSLSGYIAAIYANTYAPGMGRIEYLGKAYEYYQTGAYTSSEYLKIGDMWDWINDYYYALVDLGLVDRELTPERCLDEAIDAYQKSIQYDGENSASYNNMACVYQKRDDRKDVRRCIKRALEISLGKDGYALPNFVMWVQIWAGQESCDLLMDDASTILDYENNLSMYILYGACAIADNTNVDHAYELLCKADTYYRGKSALVKILRCICADLMGQDESLLLREIYALEQKGSLTSTEELYLIRYLFATNRYEELWGYISDVGNDSGLALDAELAAMKASWYFSNQGSDYFTVEDAEQLLEWVETRLAELTEGSEERDTLLLCRALLQSCVGQIEEVDVGPDTLTGASDLEYALIAVKAFNAGKYPEALEACDQFFKLNREDSPPSEEVNHS